jgi:phytoene synthase
LKKCSDKVNNVSIEQNIFRAGSKTYYNSALLFPKHVRNDVIKLYSFVRVADDYVDSIPQNLSEFHDLVATWQEYRGKRIDDVVPKEGDSLNVRVTKNICQLVIKCQFDPAWVDDFLHSMALDTTKKTYYTLDDTLEYMHGSAEVIGLMMARIMRLPSEAMAAASMQGRAMQYINFLRDISEDITLGRCYLPKSDLEQFNLNDLSELTAKAHPQAFHNFVCFELGRYQKWQHEADAGLYYIPKRYRLPIQGAIDAYRWTAKQIAHDPLRVYHHKVKPSKTRVIVSALVHAFD